MAQDNIFLFVPNLIGYARVVLALISFYLMPCCPWPAVFCYLLSALLDAFDGHAARALNQCLSFCGGDGPAEPKSYTSPVPAQHAVWRKACARSPADCHLWGNQPHSLSLSLSLTHSHTHTLSDSVCLLQPVLFVMCAGNELFFCLLYLLHHIQEPAAWLYWLQGLCGIICLLKSGISALHLVTASQNMAAMDAAERETSAKKQ
ncbi:CDP-diacylglycerol--inositol 3-phosphatidyltransferase [Morone saxatilis]|uniref:CDP-diacylglycerol--inositol 3-phosphatidyltransferase n=1 Tax=Morone saxatilis TaxID=34816 RepID=UPI0015E20391|nr:CDP-diacylglycerol--inositol 3-phosphatidyltransferase [Morone saxatilis]